MIERPYELRTWYPGLVCGDGARASTIETADLLYFATEEDARIAAANYSVRYGVRPESAIFLDGERIDTKEA